MNFSGVFFRISLFQVGYAPILNSFPTGYTQGYPQDFSV